MNEIIQDTWETNYLKNFIKQKEDIRKECYRCENRRTVEEHIKNCRKEKV